MRPFTVNDNESFEFFSCLIKSMDIPHINNNKGFCRLWSIIVKAYSQDQSNISLQTIIKCERKSYPSIKSTIVKKSLFTGYNTKNRSCNTLLEFLHISLMIILIIQLVVDFTLNNIGKLAFFLISLNIEIPYFTQKSVKLTPM